MRLGCLACFHISEPETLHKITKTKQATEYDDLEQLRCLDGDALKLGFTLSPTLSSLSSGLVSSKKPSKPCFPNLKLPTLAPKTDRKPPTPNS